LLNRCWLWLSSSKGVFVVLVYSVHGSDGGSEGVADEVAAKRLKTSHFIKRLHLAPDAVLPFEFRLIPITLSRRFARHPTIHVTIELAAFQYRVVSSSFRGDQVY